MLFLATRGVDIRVDSDVYGEIVRADGQGVELEVLDEVGYGYGISFNKFVKGIKGEDGVGVDGNLGWGFYRGVGAVVDISDQLTF